MMVRTFPKFISCTSSGIGLGAGTLVRRGGSHVWGGLSAGFHCLIPSYEGMCPLEGQTARAALLRQGADFVCLEGCRDGISHLPYYTESYLHPYLGIKLEKLRFDGSLFPDHASRDSRVRWEHGSRIKCPDFRTRDRRRGTVLHSRLVDSL